MHFASPEVTVIAEPGRFFVSSAYTLITRIHAKRHVYRNGDLHDVMYYINDGVYGSFNCNLYDHYTAHPIAFDKVRIDVIHTDWIAANRMRNIYCFFFRH